MNFDTISNKSNKRYSDENSRMSPKLCKLVLHPKNFSSEDFLVNSKECSELKNGDIVEIYQPDDDSCHLLLQVTSFNDEIKAVISVENSIAAAFNLRTYTNVYMKVIEDPSTVCLDSVEITFKDQYMGRSEMWRVRNWLTNTCVYINKKLEYCESSIRCQIYEMWAKGTRVACGVISENTKIVFRSSTSNLYLMIQMSSEMWDFDIHGDLYFEKAINGFLADLFNKWKKLGSNHDVTIVLFSRTFYEAKSIEEFPDAMRLCLREDHKGRIYEDFYRVAVQNDRFDDWNSVLSLLRAMFTNYQKMVLNNYDHLGPSVPKAYNSTAAQGNYLEVLNMSLNIFEKHFLDRTFDRTGQLSVVISPGVGIFEVDRELTNITMQRIIDSGVGSDLVCVGEQPLHAVPLLKFHSKHSCYLSVDDYSMPHWINLSFYSTNKKVAYSTFVPRIKLPPLELNQKYRDNMIPIQFTQFNYQMDYVHNSLFDYDEYDSQIFSSDNPPQNQYIPTSPILMDRDMSLASPRIQKLKERKLSSPDVHHSSGFDYAENSCGNQCMVMDDMIKEDHRIVRRHRWNTQRPLATRTLINPFDPAHVTVKLTSSRRRWTHIFPRGPSGLLVQQHHHNIELNAVDEKEADESIDGRSSTDGERSSISGSLVLGISNIGSMPKTKNTALLWGATGEQEWTPALTTGVDWKSLTIPACLPITTDFFPEESALQNDYVFSVYTLLPEDINMDFSVIRGSYKQPLTARDVFRELVSQRLSQGFQAIITPKKLTPSSTEDDKISRILLTPLKKKPIVSSDRQAEQLLSIGRIFHRITMNESSITVTRYRPRHLYTPKSVYYKYRFRTPFTNSYEDEYVNFSTERLENFNWNYLDQYVCARGHTDYPLTENMKYWRYRMFLLPKDDSATKRIIEMNLGTCDIYSKDTIVLSKKQCVDDFLRFLETHLNRLKRLQKKQKATSVSSPLRERLGSTRLSDKIRPRSESVKVGEKSKIFSSPLSESHSGTINAQMLDYHSEESEDAFASESLKLKPNASLPEIFDLFTHQLYGVSFLQSAPTLPSCTFTSFDAVNWISNHLEGPNDPIKILTAMKDARMICHASGDYRKPIIMGFHLYFIVQQDSKSPDFVGPLGNLKLFENEWMEVEIVDSIEKAQSLPINPDNKPLQAHQLYKECYLDVDIANKSDRAEWGHAKYHKVMMPGVAYEIAVEWIAASGSIMNDLANGWVRKALHCNFQLVPVPFDPVAEQLMEKLNPFRSPIFVPLNFEGIENAPCELGDLEAAFLETIATRFGFIPTVAAPQTKLFVHCTGFMCILLPPFNKTYTTVENDKEFHSTKTLGFLWAFNHMIQNKKWKQCLINDSDELFPHRMLKDFKCFCSNQNDRLAKVWRETNTNNRSYTIP